MSALLGGPREVDVGGGTGGLRDAWFPAFRLHQAFEVRWVPASVRLSPSNATSRPLCTPSPSHRPASLCTRPRPPHHASAPPLQIWRQHGEWVQAHRPSFGPGIKERFEAAAAVTPEQFRQAAAQRGAATQRLAELLGSDGVLALPTAPGPAPPRGTPAEQLDAFRTSLISLTCIAGLSGFPQVGW